MPFFFDHHQQFILCYLSFFLGFSMHISFRSGWGAQSIDKSRWQAELHVLFVISFAQFGALFLCLIALRYINLSISTHIDKPMSLLCLDAQG